MEENLREMVKKERMAESYRDFMETLGLSRNVVEYVVSEVNDYGERETYVIKVVR